MLQRASDYHEYCKKRNNGFFGFQPVEFLTEDVLKKENRVQYLT